MVIPAPLYLKVKSRIHLCANGATATALDTLVTVTNYWWFESYKNGININHYAKLSIMLDQFDMYSNSTA